MTTATQDLSAVTGAARRDAFYLSLALAMTGTAYLGFWFTYFGPAFAGNYPRVSPLVHVHGWSFFLWYLLLPTQAGLIRTGRIATHRLIGLCTIVLGAIMVGVGLIVSTVQVDLARRPDGSPFWQLMGLPIFAIWMLFACFYATAIYRRKHRATHKQFIVLASAVALAAATFRILVQVIGLSQWVAIAGCFAPLGFVAFATWHDYHKRRSLSPVYLWGAAAMIGLIGGAFFLSTKPGSHPVEQGVGRIGQFLSPLYLRP